MKLTLSLRISIIVVAAALVAGLAVALVDYRQTSRELRREGEEKLLALLQARTIAVSDFLDSIQRDLRMQATNPFVLEAVSSFVAARADHGADANVRLHETYVTKNPFPIAQRSRFEPGDDRSGYGLAHARFHPQLRNFTERYGFRDLLLLDLDGNVVYSVKKRDDFATNVAEAPHRTGGLARAWREATAGVASGNEAFVDFAPYEPGGGEPTGFIAVLLYDEGHRPVGVLAIEMPVDRINRVMQVGAGLGRTGETLIVGSDRLLRSASRLDSSSTILRQRISIDALARAFSGESGVSISQERRADGSAVAVLVAFQPIDFLGTRWVVAAKVDLDEIYAPVKSMGDQAVINGIGIALLVALVGFAVTRLTVARPVNQIIAAVRALAGGDRDAPLRLRPRSDEIGDVARALVQFRESMIERDRLAAEQQREAAALEAGRRFRAIAEANPVATLVADTRDGVIRYANPAAAALLGLPRDGTILVTVADLLGEPAGVNLIAEVGAHGAADHQEMRLRRTDGSAFPADLSARPIEHDGAPCLIVGILDLTERQAAQAEIEHQREMIHQREKLGALGSLLAEVAHELNNPLSIVVSQATMLQELATDRSVAVRSEKIRLAADRCARIIKTFLAMARQRPPQRQAVDTNNAVRAAVELLGYGLRTTGIEVRLELAKDLPSIWADDDQIGQILTNLIVNAQHAMAQSELPRRLTITTVLEADDGMVCLTIADNGPGIPPANRSRIFEPFFTTKPMGTGTGIGLSICKGIVTSYGGSIDAVDAPEGGAAFVVRLPVGGEDSAAVAPLAAPAAARGGRVLVVDDEVEIAEALGEILEGAGYRVDIADGGQNALEWVRGVDYEVIISDVRMAELDGLAFYRRTAELKPDLARRFIIVTGDTLSATVRAFLDETGRRCIEKPFVPAEVIRLVAAVAAGSDRLP